MSRIYLCNAFSLNMLSPEALPSLHAITACTVDDFANAARMGAINAMGHSDTAKIVSAMVGIELGAPRPTVSLKPGDRVYVAQYIGDRLPPGASELPPGAKIEFRRVTLLSEGYTDELISLVANTLKGEPGETPEELREIARQLLSLNGSMAERVRG